MDIRSFIGEGSNQDKNDDAVDGHSLLGRHNRILVVGGENLGDKVMSGIATKEFYFHKGDLEYIDYDKAKNELENVKANGRFKAIIFGPCPHKTTGTGSYACTIERMKNTEGMPLVYEAKCKSGKLKLTKESFREALLGIYTQLRQEREVAFCY